MTDTAPDMGTAEATTATAAAVAEPPGDTPDWQAEAEKYKALARKHEDRAKANSNAARELDELKKATMTDLEKAVSEAKAAGAAEARAEAGAAIVTAEFRAAAAGRLDAEALSTLLEGLNLQAFVTEDGNVDTDRVAQFVVGIAPQPDQTPRDPLAGLDLGQGARSTSNAALNGDDLLDTVKDKLGIRR